MLKIILNRQKPQAEKIIAEKQAGFRAGRSTTMQIFNLRILCEKYIQHQQDLFEACDCLKLLSIHFDLCVDATGVVCHQLGLGTDLHAVGCGGFVQTLN